MIDLHCHILPGVDDGSPDMASSLMMARNARENGIRAIVATPHCSRDYPDQNLFSRKLIDSFFSLNETISDEGIDIKIYPGMEIMVSAEFPELLHRGLLLPLAGSDYLLVEFDFDCLPETVDTAIKQILASGKRPLIAHPERYYCVQWKPELAEKWRRAGAVLQLNRGSVQGKLSQQAEDCAWQLLRSGNADVIASDAHGTYYRRAELKTVFLELADAFSWAYAAQLLIVNPASILNSGNVRRGFEKLILPD